MLRKVGLFILLAGQAWLAAAQSAAVITPGTNFLGIYHDDNPTEPNAAVGRNHIVEVINSPYYLVFDKSGSPARLSYPAPVSQTTGPYSVDTVGDMQDLFDFGTICHDAIVTSDALVLYDKWADRWLMGFITVTKPAASTLPHRFCMVVSNFADPSVTWTPYEFGVSQGWGEAWRPSHNLSNSQMISLSSFPPWRPAEPWYRGAL